MVYGNRGVFKRKFAVGPDAQSFRAFANFIGLIRSLGIFFFFFLLKDLSGFSLTQKLHSLNVLSPVTITRGKI